ncbi:MAG: HAMP domain-containing protein [bacterium]|nr:HAMP domain-containing protein [bacterium]
MIAKIRYVLVNMSVKVKFITAMVGLLVLAIPILSVVFINKSQDLLNSALRDKARLLNKNFSIVSSKAMGESSYTNLQSLIYEVAKDDKEIMEMIVVDSDGEIIATSNPEKYNQFDPFSKESVKHLLAKKDKDHILEDWSKSLFESIGFIFVPPVELDEDSGETEEAEAAPAEESSPAKPEAPVHKRGEYQGFIYVSLTTEFLEDAVRELWIYSLIITIILFLVAFYGAYRFGSLIAKPITNLALKVQAFASGNLDESIDPIESKDEIGRLIDDVEIMRKAIKDLTEHLEDKVEERTLELEASNKELEAFSYSVSHDLRSPLRSINGFSQCLMEDYFDNLDDEGKSYLNRICAASQRMSELIDDILSLSRLTRSEMNREDFNISGVVQEIVSDLQDRDPDRTVDVSVQDGIIVNADPRFMRVVLENILGNAWKYTAKKENARIEFGVQDDEGERVYFIRDNGAGFDMNHAGKLFLAFQRLHTNDEFEGTGIGLATVQRVIKRHGGNIWAEGEVGKGSTFYFSKVDRKDKKEAKRRV